MILESNLVGSNSLTHYKINVYQIINQTCGVRYLDDSNISLAHKVGSYSGVFIGNHKIRLQYLFFSRNYLKCRCSHSRA